MTNIRKGYFRLAMQSLRVSRTRSLMTVLGIVIGVVSVVVIVAIGEGVKQQIGNQSMRYGQGVLIVRPIQPGNVFEGNGLPGGASALLASSDIEVAKRSPDVTSVVPVSAITGNMSGDHTIDNPLVIATTSDLSTVLNQKVEYGGFFTPGDGENVVTLGADIAHRLFDDTAPLGRKVMFRGKEFVVAGVFKPFVAAPFSLEANYNQAAFIPYGTAEGLLGAAPQVNQIFVQAKSGVDTAALGKTLEHSFAAAHGGTHDTAVMSPGSHSLEKSDRTLGMLTLMTVGMAIIALIVGGVGIMNMMLVSVTERIHEIGLRKAIGATNRQILRQFVTEAFVLCLMGAVVGLVVALGVIGALRIYTSLQPVVVWWVVFAAPAVSLGIGVLFGTIPAIKAARMDPIEALRHE